MRHKEYHNAKMLRECVEMVASISGPAVELGVFNGSGARLLCEAMPDRMVHLVDSCQGLPERGPRDSNKAGDFRGSERMIRETLRGLDNWQLHVGWFAVVLPMLDLQHIAFAHVDCDQESSTREALEWLVPRMARGGVIVCDDYQMPSCRGATAVIDELLPGVRKHAGHGGWWRAVSV